ncbi:MAG: leucyl aminopeptidase family protein [Lactobacillaceae bacterium]|jgi:leucyl aminopeptidase|nr:leucyl aminopeptidase family protein [Lactobacillaceae bacterium]
MVEYVLNGKSKNVDARVVLVDKKTKKISKEIAERFSKEELKLFEKVIKDDMGKKDFINVYTNASPVILFLFDFAAENKELQKYGAMLSKAVFTLKNVMVFTDKIKNGVEYLILGLELGRYRFNKYFTKDVDSKTSALKSINIIDVAKSVKKADISKAVILSGGVNYVKDLVNEPANYLNPETFAKILSGLEEIGVKIEVLDEKKLKSLGFNLLLAVASGSANKPRVVVLSWNGNDNSKEYDITLVGKGVTFDSGGLSIKTGGYMEGMHTDMAGAGVVSGVIKVAGELKLKKNILGIVGLVENMPSGSAYRVNDIIKSMSGQTVEVLNTDAEGRLVLADLLTYVQQKYKAKRIVDLATLTGAVSMLFGPVYAGLFSNNDKMIKDLTTAGNNTGDRLWNLPMDNYFNKAMDSTYADMQNSGKHRVGGGSQGACFLKRFIKDKTIWSHLDIAGVARESLDDDLYAKGATGYGVKLLIDYIENMK